MSDLIITSVPLAAPAAQPAQRLIDPESDRVLVIRAAAGDDRAFAQIVRRHTAHLTASAYRILTNRTDADDVVQDTFITAWTHMDSVIDGDTIGSWLTTTARRKSYDRLRALAAQKRTHLDNDDAFVDHCSTATDAHHTAITADLRKALTSLPALQEQCWRLRELDGYSYKEIATRLGLSEATVRGNLARARSATKRALAHWR